MSNFDRKKNVSGFYTADFAKIFRSFFLPLSRGLMSVGVTPNTVTIFTLVLGIFMCVFLSLDYLWTGMFLGLALGFLDIVDGQLAKNFYGTSKFGGILDSTIDRYTEFLAYTGLGIRYYILERPWWILLCALGFLGSVMISYVKARAEAEGMECKVGKLQRPERLTILGVGILFRGIGIDVAISFLAVLTQLTVIRRILHVYRQSNRSSII